jgi:uncharacterized membrane protein
MSFTKHEPGPVASALHGILLSFPVALFSAGLAADVAYFRTSEIQWTNFASWLIAGALVFGGLVLAWALIEWIVKLRRPASSQRLVYLIIVAVMWVVGLINAFHHAHDGWNSVGTTGLAMSIATMVLALAAGWMLFSRTPRWEVAR